MKNICKKGISVLLFFLLLWSVCFTQTAQAASIVHTGSGEFRGIWVATVLGIDYPSKATTNDKDLRNEATVILDNIKDMGFNVVFFQVRPCSDAFYKSNIFPWSQHLTGTQGLAPSNGFDPLAFFIEEAHKRGIELHAWINPYRITVSAGDNAKLAQSSPALKYPELTVLHSDGKMYFNPGEPAARPAGSVCRRRKARRAF